MSRILSTALVLGLILGGSTAATAAGGKKKAKKTDPIAALFAKIDTNGDKKISKDEFDAFKGPLKAKAKEVKAGKEKKAGKGQEARRAAVFAKLDTNGDGFLSLEEFSKIKEILAEVKAKKKGN